MENLVLSYNVTKSEIDEINVKIKQLQSLKKEKSLKISDIANQIASNMPKKSIVVGEYQIKVRTTKRTVITNADALPKEFLVSKTTYKPDARKIKSHLESGKELDGARIEVCDSLTISAIES